MNFNSFIDVKSHLHSGKTTCVQVVDYFLKNIKEKNTLLNAFVEVYETEAKTKAIAVDQKIKEGKAGRLAGLVIGIKDVISHEGHALRASSKILENYVAQYNATVIERLLAEDAIIIGRQNCDEFAMGSSNEKSVWGVVRNAADTELVPGGSSGGSAVCVQANMCMVSLGSDTGGSVRQPASFCGIVGLKPTYSRISRWGLIAYASSFDCIGIFAHDSKDIAAVLEIIAGADDKDSTVSQKLVPEYSALLNSTKKYKIAYLKEGLESKGVQKDVKDATALQIEKLKAAGHTLEPVTFDLLDYSIPAYYILTTAEASSNLSRYDAVKFGHRSSETTDLMSMYKKSRAEGFGKEVKKRIMLGTYVLSASYYDAYYTKAQKIRRLIKNEFDGIFSKYDFLIMPTSPITAFKIGELSDDPLAMYLADIFTVSANIAGVPGISVPIGEDSQKLPIGLQILANDFQEAELLAFANTI